MEEAFEQLRKDKIDSIEKLTRLKFDVDKVLFNRYLESFLRNNPQNVVKLDGEYWWRGFIRIYVETDHAQNCCFLVIEIYTRQGVYISHVNLHITDLANHYGYIIDDNGCAIFLKDVKEEDYRKNRDLFAQCFQDIEDAQKNYEKILRMHYKVDPEKIRLVCETNGHSFLTITELLKNVTQESF